MFCMLVGFLGRMPKYGVGEGYGVIVGRHKCFWGGISVEGVGIWVPPCKRNSLHLFARYGVP